MTSYGAKELILLYLRDYDTYKERGEVPYGVSLPGISNSIGAKRDKTSEEIDELIDLGLVEKKTKYVRGRKRKRNVYFLTSKGIEEEREMRKEIKDQTVKIKIGDEIKEIKLADIDEYIEQEDPIVKTLSRMEKEGVVDLSQRLVPEDVFVGRTEEMKLLREKLEEVKASGSTTIFISGEAGVGKTRLVSELKTHALGEGFDFLTGTCISDMGDPYLPFKEAFKDHMLNGKKEEISRVAFIGAMKGRRISNKRMFDAEREATFYETTDYIRDMAESSPMVVFLDDVQWMDRASAQILNYMTYKLGKAPVLFICPYRPEDLSEEDPVHDIFQHMMTSYPNVVDIELSPLGEGATEEVIQGLLQTDEVPGQFVELIHKKTSGNPLFVKECIKHMVEEDSIDPDKGIFPKEDVVSVPDIIQQVIERRINRLDNDAKKVMEIGSVIGDVIDYSILVEVSDVNTFDLLDHIDILFSTGLWEESPDEERIYFHHSITRDTVYRGLRDIKKRLLHKKIARCMEEVYKGRIDDFYPNLAFHHHNAEQYEEAFEYYIKAGEKAKELYAYEDAIEMYEKALILTEKFGDGTEKMIDIREELSEIYQVLGEYDKGRDHLRSILEEDIAASKECRIYRKLARSWLLQGNLETALEKVEAGMSLLEEGDGFEKELCKFLSLKGWINIDFGEHDRAIELFKEQEGIAERLNDDQLKGRANHDLGSVYYTQGKVDAAKEHLEKAIDTWREIDERHNLVSSLNNLGLVNMYKGRWDEAKGYFKENLENSKKMGDILGMSISYNNLGDIYRETGNFHEALEHFSKAREIQDKIGDRAGRAGSITNIAITHHLMGDLDKALKLQEESLKIFKEVNNNYRVAWVLQVMADILIEKGELEKAKENLKKANELYRKMGEKGESSITKASLADISLRKGHLEEAKEMAEEALENIKDGSVDTVEGRCRLIIGKVYRKMGLWDDAEREFHKAKERLKNTVTIYPKTLYELGMLYKAIGEESTAKSSIEEAKDIFENTGMSSWVEKCGEILEDMDGGP